MVIAIAVVELNIIWINLVHVQVAVRVVVSVWLVVLRVPQPPWRAVVGVPTTLLRHPGLHRVLGTAATAVR